nr:MAG TPA: hypothetical protein [Bacteriophage sp.]
MIGGEIVFGDELSQKRQSYRGRDALSRPVRERRRVL